MPHSSVTPLDPNSPEGRQAADELTDILASVLNRLDDERHQIAAVASMPDNEAA